MENKTIKVWVKIIIRNRSVSAKFSLYGVDLPNPKERKGIKVSKNKDFLTKEYEYSMNPLYFDQLMEVMNIKKSEIKISDESIKEFYHYETTTNQFNDALDFYFVTNWAKSFYPSVYKYKVNFDLNSKVIEGKKLLCFNFKELKETENEILISKYITKNEIEKLLVLLDIKSLEYKKIKNFYERFHYSIEEYEKSKEFVRDYEERVQKIFKDHEKEIKEYVEEDLKNINSFSFDCGVVFLTSMNEEYNNHKGILLNKETMSNEIREYPYIRINYPIGTQSTTIQLKMIKVAEKYLKEEFEEEFFTKVILD